MRYIALIVLVLALAACGSSAKPAAVPSFSSAAPSVTTSAAAAGITCGDIQSDLNTVVSDLKAEDAKLQEAWVSGGDSADLQALINDTNGASGSDVLDTDAATFNSDASAYLSDNSPFLAPGWETGFDQVTNDINALAKDCGQPTAPPNSPSSP
jgi:ABC-type glycerol-3-phosphate transport system substrate-binding protein